LGDAGGARLVNTCDRRRPLGTANIRRAGGELWDGPLPAIALRSRGSKGVAAGHGNEPCLLIRIRWDGDPGTVLTAGFKHLGDRLHACQRVVHSGRIEGLVQANGSGQVPGVDKNVGEKEPPDRFVESMRSRIRVADLSGGRSRVAEKGLKTGIQRGPRSCRVVVDRRPIGQRRTTSGGEEGGHPFDHVPHDIASDPAVAGRGSFPIPVRNVVGPQREAGRNSPVTLGDLAHRLQTIDDSRVTQKTTRRPNPGGTTNRPPARWGMGTAYARLEIADVLGPRTSSSIPW
jgi:hypothetical protein